MNISRALEMDECGNLPIQQLQHEIIDALQTSSRRWIHGISRQFFQFGLNPADDAIEPAIDNRMGGADKHWRNEFVVKQNVLVTHLEDPRNTESHVAWLGGFAQFKRKPRRGDLDFLFDPKRGC